MLSKHTHQRLFMKKNKNHLEGKVLPADLEHKHMYNKINILEAENLGYVKSNCAQWQKQYYAKWKH